MIELVLALSAVGILLYLVGSSLDEEHVILKLLNYCFIVLILLIIAKVGMDYQINTCEIQLMNTTVSGNITSYVYDRVCISQPFTTGKTFYRLITWYNIIFAFYVIIFLVYYHVWGLMKKVIQK